MNKLFFNKNKNTVSARNFLRTIIFSMFLLLNVSFAIGQVAPRIPSADANGNFGDIQVDGDRVKIVSQPGTPGKIQIKLDADSSWWHSLNVKTKNGTNVYVEQHYGGFLNGKDVIEINGSDLNNTFSLDFWKAKFLGVHTHVMSETFRKRDFLGRSVKFVWQEGLASDSVNYSLKPINDTMTVNGQKLTIKSSENGRKGYATIKFQTAISSRTSLNFYDRSGTGKMITKDSGRYNPATKTLQIPLKQLKSTIELEFWTAKFLGVQTKMGSRKLFRERFDGRTITILWGKAVEPINYRLKVDGTFATIKSTEKGTPGYATIVFKTNKPGWTALSFKNRNNTYRTISRQGGYTPRSGFIKIPIKDLPSTVSLEFWTAKFLGIHTYMGNKLIANDRFDGRVVTITWNK